MKTKIKYVIGIDEVGRGPLAGPVAVCAFAMPYGYDQKVFVGVKDSKKLSKIAREKWAKIAGEMKKNKKCFHSVCFTGHKIIDQKGIVKAIKMALGRALKKVLVEISCGPEECEVLLDGSLKAPKIFSFQETIIKGDSKVQIISLASVVAKVKRDKKMTILAKKYPNYGFEIHKGYGTSYHYKQIKKLGLSEIHRRSYLKNLQKTIV
ncbi:MAG: ribonuclease HII [Candidatus Paceibacterota bacterium]